jgi:hypothetical protein
MGVLVGYVTRVTFDRDVYRGTISGPAVAAPASTEPGSNPLDR